MRQQLVDKRKKNIVTRLTQYWRQIKCERRQTTHFVNVGDGLLAPFPTKECNHNFQIARVPRSVYQ